MTSISAKVKRILLEIPLRRPSPDRIPRSGKAGEAINCYTTRVFPSDSAPLIIKSAEGETINCLEYDGNRYSIKTQQPFNKLASEKFEFTHYHGLYEAKYSGWLDLALGRIFRAPYIKTWIHKTYHQFIQRLYNRRKLITKQRIDLLKVILNAQLNGRDRISSLSVMTMIHTENWYLHPDRDDEQHRVQLYLELLAETNELEKHETDYKITGQGVSAIELYEEQERKHKESMSIQRRMLFLTIVIVVLTLVQAGLVKLPTLLNLTANSGYTALKACN